MAGIISTASYPRGLLEGVKAWWNEAGENTPKYWLSMFDKIDSEKNYEEYVQSVALGLTPQKPEGSPLEYDSMNQGFSVKLTNLTYALGIIVTYEEIQDNLYMKLAKERAAALHEAFHETKNVLGANVYNNAFNSSFTGCDGVSLLNTAHPNFSGGTWQNKFAVDSALSQLSVQDMLILMMQSRDDRGNIQPLKARDLVVHPYNHFNGQVLMKTAKATGSNINDINPIMQGGLIRNLISNPYLTANGPWFLTTGCRSGMIYQERESLRNWEDNDFDTMNYKFAAMERYALGWANPRGLFGSNAP